MAPTKPGAVLFLGMRSDVCGEKGRQYAEPSRKGFGIFQRFLERAEKSTLAQSQTTDALHSSCVFCGDADIHPDVDRG